MNDAGNKPKIDIAAVIRNVRKVDTKIAEMETKHAEELAPLKEMSEAGRAYLLTFLNDTGQKGTTTTEGGCHKKTKTTFQVRDREKFKEFVIEGKLWEMIVWRANDAMCGDYVQARKEAPPGTHPNSIEFVTITAPAKPRLRKKKPGTLTEEEWAEINREVDEELALENEKKNGETQDD